MLLFHDAQLYLHSAISAPNREVSGSLDSTAVTPQYRRGGSPVPSSVPECSDSHELETLMLQGSHECGHPLEEASEEQSLMASANQGEEEETPTPEPKVRICNSKALYQTGFEYFLSHVG